ncbi:hypothetical protein Q2T40_05115 [Winogradskyella maritima]|nr:hypothetical protein [Winogradskyella maritima]
MKRRTCPWLFTADLRSSPEALPRLTNLKNSETYQFQWWDVTNGVWIDVGEITTDNSGTLKTPSVPTTTGQRIGRIEFFQKL